MDRYNALARERYQQKKEKGIEPKNRSWFRSEKGKAWIKEYKRKKRRVAGVISREENRKLRALIDAAMREIRALDAEASQEFKQLMDSTSI